MMSLLSSPPQMPDAVATGQTDFNFDELDLVSCRKLWRRKIGPTPHKHVSLQLMRRVLAYEAQCKAFGGLPTDVKRAFKRVSKQVLRSNNTNAGDAITLPNPSSLLSPGTQLVREWNGRTYQVEVTANGYVLDGQTFKSLSAIAKRITGTQWSGPRFFGLQKR